MTTILSIVGKKPKKSEPANPDLTYYKFTRKNDWFVTNQSGLRANSSNNSFMILFWASIRNKGIGEAEPLKLLKDYGWRFKYSYTIEEGSPVPFAEDSYKRAKMKLDEKPKEKKTWNYYTRTKFKKDDDGKLKPTLIDSLFLSAFASVLTKGAKKYGKDNWKECDDLDRYKDALERHWLLYKTGQKNDRETGISHLAHIACSAMFLFYFDMEEKILDYVDFEVGYKK